MGRHNDVMGSAGLHLVGGARLLHPREQVFEAMLEGWRNQRMARNLAESSVDGGEQRVRALVRHLEVYPWEWTPAMVDEWFADLRGVRHLARSTLRGYQVAIRGFCGFITDPAYGWTQVCEEQFGTHPIQVLNEVNSAAHVADSEADAAKRAFTRDELQALFDHADDQVAQKRALAVRAGCQRSGTRRSSKPAPATAPAAARRRCWTSPISAVIPTGPSSASTGFVTCATARRRKVPHPNVAACWPCGRGREILDQWFTEVRPLISADGNPAAWPSERGIRVGVKQLNKRLAEYRDALSLDPVLDFHSLRRSYVTHLIEDGWDPRFVQEQVGHDHASTTSIYTCVSSDYRVRTLRRALDATLADALGQGKGGGRR